MRPYPRLGRTALVTRGTFAFHMTSSFVPITQPKEPYSSLWPPSLGEYVNVPLLQ
jgi:hypothetical protein